MKVPFLDKEYPVRILKAIAPCMGPKIAWDVETNIIVDGVVATYVIGAAFNGKEVCLVPAHTLASFWKEHAESTILGHSVNFDLQVCEKAIGVSLFGLLDKKQVIDASLLYRLSELARVGEVPRGGYGLKDLTEKLLGVELSKDAEIRCEFGQFIRENGTVDYQAIPHEFLQYAALDAVATWFVCEKLSAMVETRDWEGGYDAT